MNGRSNDGMLKLGPLHVCFKSFKSAMCIRYTSFNIPHTVAMIDWVQIGYSCSAMNSGVSPQRLHVCMIAMKWHTLFLENVPLA